MGASIPDTQQLFDEWPGAYNNWFTTPIGTLVKHYETELLLDLLDPRSHERILDVGCGTGVFTADVLARCDRVIGLDISMPMLCSARKELDSGRFASVTGDMARLPFKDGFFDKTFSMTALEFVNDAESAVRELERVTRRGGRIVLTTLNSLSPWAARREKKARAGHVLFQNMIFRSPGDLIRIVPEGAVVKTAIFFAKDDTPARAEQLEEDGRRAGGMTGACVAVSWKRM